MFMNGLPFLVTSLQGLSLVTIEHLPSRTAKHLVQTLERVFNKVKKAKEVQRIQGMIANPTEREFAGMVREQLLTNCPVTMRDVDNANRIFGPD